MKNKNMRIKNNLTFVVLGVFLSLTFGSLVSGAGIGAPYGSNYPLSMYPGETKDAWFTLQNMANGEDVKFEIELTSGDEVATLTDRSLEYLVPLGSNDVRVNLRVKVPEGVSIGSEYLIGVKASQIPLEEGGGTVQLSAVYDISFPVVVVPEPSTPPTEKGTSNWVWVIGILVLLAIVWFILKKKKK